MMEELEATYVWFDEVESGQTMEFWKPHVQIRILQLLAIGWWGSNDVLVLVERQYHYAVPEVRCFATFTTGFR